MSGFVPAGGEGLDVFVLGLQECWYSANKDSAAETAIPFWDGKTKPVHDMFGAFRKQLGSDWVAVEVGSLHSMRERSVNERQWRRETVA